jgi:hypothetical protein
MTAPPRRIWLWFAGMLAVVALCYSNHFHNSFQFDDFHLTNNLVTLGSIGFVDYAAKSAAREPISTSPSGWPPAADSPQ